MNIVILTAGGVGSRMNQSVPKQFMKINDKPLIVYTIEKFQSSSLIDEIVISCLDGWQEELKKYVEYYGLTKVKSIVTGGKSGQESIYNGFKKIVNRCNDNDNVIIHDGNRPNISQEIIENGIKLCEEKGIAVAYIPCQEVMFISEDKITSNEQIDRSKLARTQTPHVFKKKLLEDSFREARNKGINNEVAICSLLQKLGNTIYLYEGDEKNIKITFQSDIDIFQSLLYRKDI